VLTRDPVNQFHCPALVQLTSNLALLPDEKCDEGGAENYKINTGKSTY
jgi:hypothetical protein